MRAIHRAALICALVIVPAAQAQSPLPPGTWGVPDAPAEMRHTISRADLIVASMQDALLRELTEGLRAGGPARAIKSCHIDVIRIIQRIGRQEAPPMRRRPGVRERRPPNARCSRFRGRSR